MAASRPSQTLHPWDTSITGVIAGCGVLAVALFMAVPVAVNLPSSWVGGVIALILFVIGITIVRRSVRRGDSEGSVSAKEQRRNAF